MLCLPQAYEDYREKLLSDLDNISLCSRSDDVTAKDPAKDNALASKGQAIPRPSAAKEQTTLNSAVCTDETPVKEQTIPNAAFCADMTTGMVQKLDAKEKTEYGAPATPTNIRQEDDSYFKEPRVSSSYPPSQLTYTQQEETIAKVLRALSLPYTTPRNLDSSTKSHQLNEGIGAAKLPPSRRLHDPLPDQSSAANTKPVQENTIATIIDRPSGVEFAIPVPSQETKSVYKRNGERFELGDALKIINSLKVIYFVLLVCLD